MTHKICFYVKALVDGEWVEREATEQDMREAGYVSIDKIKGKTIDEIVKEINEKRGLPEDAPLF